MAPNPARKFTQSVSARGRRFPATAPTTISIRATDIAARIEIIAATRAKPNHKADASKTFSKALSFAPGERDRDERLPKDPHRSILLVGVISLAAALGDTHPPQLKEK